MGVWQVPLLLLLTISAAGLPLGAHGKHTLAGVGRRHHHRNHTSPVDQEALDRRAVLSDDSAERDHLIGAGLSLGAGLPLSSSSHRRAHKRLHLDFSDEDQHLGGGEELTAGGAGAGPDQPGNPAADNDVITVEFHSPAPDTAPSEWPRGASPSGPQRQKGGNPTAWTLSDFYDYLAPDDDLSALDATPVPEPSPSPPADMDDENPRLPDAAGKGWPPAPQPPLQGGGGGGVKGPAGAGLGGVVGSDGCRPGFVRVSGPGACVPQCDADPDFCLNGGVCTVVAEVGAFCRCNVQGYIWNKGTRCDWAVTEFQVMCVVVGGASLVLLFLFMIVVFFAKKLHHLKKENKQLRKRRYHTSSGDDVWCKYRPQSAEPQTDGMSVSTTADGSQPNVRKLCDTPPPPPQAHAHNLAYYDNIICQDDPQKKEELVKTPPPKQQEEESMNIRNSHPSPKQENVRPISAVQQQQQQQEQEQQEQQEHGHAPNNTEQESTEGALTIGLELLLPKEAKLHPDTGPPLQYDVFLYKLPADAEPAAASPEHPEAPEAPKPPKSPRAPKSPRSPKCYPSPGRLEVSGAGCSSSPGCYDPSSSSPHHHHHHQQAAASSRSPPQLRRPPGRSQGPGASGSGCGSGSVVLQSQGGAGVHLRPSPSSPHLSQPPPSPSCCGYNAASTRSLPPLS